jgi:hypothetical protein
LKNSFSNQGIFDKILFTKLFFSKWQKITTKKSLCHGVVSSQMKQSHIETIHAPLVV